MKALVLHWSGAFFLFIGLILNIRLKIANTIITKLNIKTDMSHDSMAAREARHSAARGRLVQ